MDTLTPEEVKDYKAMLHKQRHKPRATKQQPVNIKNVITDAYIQSLCLSRSIVLKEQVNVSAEMKDKIQDLYIKGVLPIRLGGINL